MFNLSRMLADKYIDFIEENNDEQTSSREVLRYSLIPKIDVAICSTFVLIMCLITGNFLSGILSVAGFTVLRWNSGGIHFKSQMTCNVVSTIMILAAIYMPINFWYYGFILNSLSFLIIVLCAPSVSKKHEIKDPKLEKSLKIKSSLIVALNFMLQSHVLSAAFFIQAVTTLKPVQLSIEKLKL